MLSRTFGMETAYIQKLTQDMLDLKYVTVLDKHKVNGKEKKYQKILKAKFHINYLRLLYMN